jgi:copper chaperone CopZ
MAKINERGTHTTTIEGAIPILKVFNKMSVEVSPGVIQANVKSKGRSVKLKKLNDETFEMVVVVKSSKQTFKVYGKDQGKIIQALDEFKKDNWNVQGVLDISK